MVTLVKRMKTLGRRFFGWVAARTILRFSVPVCDSSWATIYTRSKYVAGTVWWAAKVTGDLRGCALRNPPVRSAQSLCGGDAARQRVDVRMEDVGEDFQAIHEARPRPTEVGAAVHQVDAPRADAGQTVEAGVGRQDRQLLA